ncbi:MAG: hypothetical protein K6G28_05735 [Acholeplasmatales bacterium]|nr:hypothetical protein [Acholeplasmatales bacterium]
MKKVNLYKYFSVLIPILVCILYIIFKTTQLFVANVIVFIVYLIVVLTSEYLFRRSINKKSKNMNKSKIQDL